MTRQGMASILTAGATYRSLSDALGIDPDATRMRAKRAGLRSQHRHRPPDPVTGSLVRTARQMLAQGCEVDAVAERLGMKVPAVRAMLRRAAT